MSNQSGITADQELLDTIGALTTETAGSAVVVAQISSDNTSVRVAATLHSTDQLSTYLSSHAEPAYIWVRRGAGKVAFVSYMPETTPVRAKMLYASTKNTVSRQVGSNHISLTLMASSADELVADLSATPAAGATGDAATHNAAGTSVLTESERQNLEISRQQKTEGSRAARALVSQNNGTAHTLSFKVASDKSISDLLREFSFVSFKIDIAKEQVEILATAQVSQPTQLPDYLDSTQPSYNLYHSQGRNYFIYSCPSGSKVKERMLYASNKSGFLKHLKEVDGVDMAKTVEVGDADELELSDFGTESNAGNAENVNSAAGRLKFNRPKRPGRRTGAN
ncbi:LAMI_0D09692g1_1 [Lachancea mirantina]|uniref:LAMI_0D09692g1_1 n=1 Tax=Lachancea mirantina TaxID=1230905 RepID=A0A1G4JDN0_9SACH|nr:LAMI_0D09692g1_1 [Lachancea mirantina]